MRTHPEAERCLQCKTAPNLKIISLALAKYARQRAQVLLRIVIIGQVFDTRPHHYKPPVVDLNSLKTAIQAIFATATQAIFANVVACGTAELGEVAELSHRHEVSVGVVLDISKAITEYDDGSDLSLSQISQLV